ncbi:hypothetical protein [Candidatus Palauibacter sp.]|uniref:hypothetical protein n=1 Tax=Candidatus Palauibacter sp. TaxID=3101350 RepID=UPI003B5A7BDA
MPDAERGAGPAGRVDFGVRRRLPGLGGMDLRRSLGGASFVLPLGRGGGGEGGQQTGASPTAAVWGGADFRNLTGPGDDAVEWSGDILSVHGGADLRLGRGLLAGVALGAATRAVRRLPRAGTAGSDVSPIRGANRRRRRQTLPPAPCGNQ